MVVESGERLTLRELGRMLAAMINRKAGHRANDHSEYLERISVLTLYWLRYLFTRPMTMKKSSRPMFLMMLDLT